MTCFGALLQKHYRVACLGFGTCTVPRFPDAVLRAIGKEWGEITRRYFQKLRRACQKKGSEFIYFGVSEIQEKRYKRFGVPVPHLHYGYVCRDKRGSEFYFTASEARRFWRESINESLKRVNIAPPGESVDYNAAIDLQLVKKSIGAYMAKYLSKGIKTAQKIIDDGFEDMLPKQWWFASMQMKEALKKSTVKTTQEECASFFYGIEKLLHGCKVEWCNFVDVEVSPGEYRIFGIVGRLSKEEYARYAERIDKQAVREVLSLGYNQGN